MKEKNKTVAESAVDHGSGRPIGEKIGFSAACVRCGFADIAMTRTFILFMLRVKTLHVC